MISRLLIEIPRWNSNLWHIWLFWWALVCPILVSRQVSGLSWLQKRPAFNPPRSLYSCIGLLYDTGFELELCWLGCYRLFLAGWETQYISGWLFFGHNSLPIACPAIPLLAESFTTELIPIKELQSGEFLMHSLCYQFSMYINSWRVSTTRTSLLGYLYDIIQ